VGKDKKKDKKKDKEEKTKDKISKVKVKVCKKCSNFDVTELEGMVKHYKTGCIGKCAHKCPELKGKIYGYLNGDFVVCDTKEQFFAKIADMK